MSKFIPPKTTTAVRLLSTPLQGELLFDTDEDRFYLGDGVTVGGVLVGTGSGGDMLKSTYDSDNNGIVDTAEAIAGSPTASQYYGTNSGGTKGFYDLPSNSIESITDGTTTVSGAASISFTSGATVANNNGVAEVAIAEGDMLKSTYDSNNDGIVDQADLANEAIAIQGTPTASQYYGTNEFSVKGFYTLPELGTSTGGSLDAITDGTTTVSGATALAFTSGAVVTNNNGVAEVAIAEGDMLKSTYDSDNDGIVDTAEAIAGSPTASQYYGTDSGGTKGFYDIPRGESLNRIYAVITAAVTI